MRSRPQTRHVVQNFSATCSHLQNFGKFLEVSESEHIFKNAHTGSGVSLTCTVLLSRSESTTNVLEIRRRRRRRRRTSDSDLSKRLGATERALFFRGICFTSAQRKPRDLVLQIPQIPQIPQRAYLRSWAWVSTTFTPLFVRHVSVTCPFWTT